jgi:hypothetical protein
MQPTHLSVAENVLFVSDAEFGDTWAIDTLTHEVLWSRDDVGRSVPMVLPGGGLLCSGGNSLSRVHGKTGATEWTLPFKGYFADDGYVAVVGRSACAVMYGDSEAGLSNRIIFDVATGRLLAVELPHNPLPDTVSEPPRFLYEVPDVRNSWEIRRTLRTLHPRPDAPSYPYSVGSLEAADGEVAWTIDLGTISSERRPRTAVVHGSLGVCRFARREGGTRSTELWWLDLSRGQVLRRDESRLRPAQIWVLMMGENGSATQSAETTLDHTSLLAIRGENLLLTQPGSAEQELWRTSLKSYVPDELLGDGRALWRATRYADPLIALTGTSRGLSVVLLVNTREGSVKCVLRAQEPLPVVELDPAGRALYVVVGDRLTAYDLTSARQESILAGTGARPSRANAHPLHQY